MTDRIEKIATELTKMGMQPWPARSDSKAPARDGWRNHEGWEPPSDLRFNGTYGLLMGERSGNMEMLEIEGRAVNDGTAEDFIERLNEAGLGDLWSEIEAGMQVFSPSGGAHYYYRVDGDPAGNTKLAFDETPDRPETLIETRGEGGFVVGPGSRTEDGREWKLAAGSHPKRIPTITPEQRDAIFDVARSLDRRVRKSPETPVDGRLTAGNSGDDLRDYVTQEMGVAELLEEMGWEIEGGNGQGGVLWTRPGKDEGTSGELKADGCFFVYSTTAQAAWKGSLFDGEFPWATPLGVLAEARFGGHIDKAMSWVRAQITGTTAEPGDSDPEAWVNPWADDVSLWETLEGVENGTIERPQPTVGTLRGTDHGWLYPGMFHGLYGEPGAGKTWLALQVAMEEIEAGRRVLIADYEGSPYTTAIRMHKLGLRSHHRGLLDYRNVVGATMEDAVVHLTGEYALVVVDSTGEAMGSEADLNSYDDGDTARWFQMLRRMHKALGSPTVVLLDHVVKASDGRGKYAIGSQRKLATVDVAFGVAGTVTTKGGGQGRVTLTVNKDRHETLGAPGSRAADIFVVEDENSIRLEFHRPTRDLDEANDAQAKAGRPTSRELEEVVTHLSGYRDGGAAAWVDWTELSPVGKHGTPLAKRVEVLVEEGAVETRPAPRPEGAKGGRPPKDQVRLVEQNFFD